MDFVSSEQSPIGEETHASVQIYLKLIAFSVCWDSDNISSDFSLWIAVKNELIVLVIGKLLGFYRCMCIKSKQKH